jgi:transposase
MKNTRIPKLFYAGIDYHKRYSIVHVIDDEGRTVCQRRVHLNDPRLFQALFSSLKGPCRVVFESCMNWCKLYDLLQSIPSIQQITLAHPYKTRIIAEAQVKTDKIDARMLAVLLRAELICQAHISSQEARRQKDILRQRTFFVRMRTRLRNRVHRLLGAQLDLALPDCSDLFGARAIAYLRQLQLPAPADLLLRQDLDQLIELERKIKELEAIVKEQLARDPIMQRLESLPGVGPIISAVIAHEIDGIQRFLSPQKLCGYAGLAPTTDSSGGKTYQGRLMRHCNKWLRWAYVEAAWVAVGCDPYFKAFYHAQRLRGKKPNTAIIIVAKRLCRISYQLLTQNRDYEKRPFSPTAPHLGVAA